MTDISGKIGNHDNMKEEALADVPMIRSALLSLLEELEKEVEEMTLKITEENKAYDALYVIAKHDVLDLIKSKKSKLQ